MLDPRSIPPVAPDETLARYILFSKWFRSSDRTVKPDAFMPHPLVKLSLTRHLEATEGDLWREGARVAAIRKLNLYGRADVEASAFLKEQLGVHAEPLLENPNHVDAIDWPTDKAAQKMKAIAISIASRFVSNPS